MNKNRRVIALGFFDGVHNGHGALLRRVVDKARELDAVAAAIIVERWLAAPQDALVVE